MKIGKLEINKCSDCPGFYWVGENMSEGDLGFSCSFRAFTERSHKNVKEIPEDCPLKEIVKKAELYDYTI